MIDVMSKIRNLQKQRGWNDAELIKKAGLTHSILSSLKKRNNLPTITTLDAICSAFGITLSQFFNEYNNNELTPEQIELLQQWDTLNDKQKYAVMELLKNI